MATNDVLTLLAVSAPMIVVYAAQRAIVRKLTPPFVAMELASDQKHAKNVLNSWNDSQQTGRALLGIILDLILIVGYVGAIQYVLFSILSHDANVLMWITVAFIVAVFAAGLVNLTGDAFLLIILVRGHPYAPLVTAVRLLAWFRFATMSLTIVYLVFRAEVRLYEQLALTFQNRDWQPILALIAVTLILTFIVMRRLSVFSANHPPVLALLLSHDRLMANSVLERWGKRGRRQVTATLVLQCFVALLYGVSLSALCHKDFCVKAGPEIIATVFAWIAIIAASCHIAQNIGALIAVEFGHVGWWLGWMRRMGKTRIALAWAIGLYFAALLIRGEWLVIRVAKGWITSHMPPIRF